MTAVTPPAMSAMTTLPVGDLRPVRAPLVRLLRSELRWVFRRPRTLVALGLLALFPVGVGIGTLFAGEGVPNPPGPNGGAGATITALAGNGLTLPVITLAMTMVFLLPLVGSMSAADAIAGEAANGTLRGLLVAPVSRPRLLVVKATGVAVVMTVAVAAVAAFAVVTGLILNGTDELITLSGTTLPLGETLGRVAAAAGWVLVQMWAICAIALAVSACTEHPIVVMATVVGGMIVISLLASIPALDWLKPFLITDSWPAVADLLRDPVPTGDLTVGLLRAVCYLVIGYSLAAARMVTKDG